MNVRLYSTPDEFASAARWVYRRDPVLFTVELTTARSRVLSADRVMLSVADDAGVFAAAVQGDDGCLLVSGLPARSIGEVVAKLSARGIELPAVRGTRAAATAFVDAWCTAVGAGAEVSDEETLYRLGTLEPPSGVPGKVRLSADDDGELVVDWLDAFFADAFDIPSDREARRGYLREIAHARGRILVWTVDDVPVSMARLHAPSAGMTRVGPVYTPLEHRGRGYAAAVTSAAAEDAIGRGVRDVVLFADVNNAVSNGVYRRIGFEPVTRHVRFGLTLQASQRLSATSGYVRDATAVMGARGTVSCVP